MKEQQSDTFLPEVTLQHNKTTPQHLCIFFHPTCCDHLQAWPSNPSSVKMASKVTSRAKSMHSEALDKYDDLADPIPTEEQESLLRELKQRNDASNYFYRASLLFMVVLVFVLYLTPIPSYIDGSHPENHLTLFHHGVHVIGTEEHLTYLPAFPIYMIFLGIQGYCLYLAAFELISLMGHDALLARLSGRNAAVYRSHPFGTAPRYLISFLSELRWSTGNKVNLNERADQPAQINSDSKPVHDSLSNPRLLYLWIIFIASCPMPLLIFGAGNFSNAGWFSFTPAVIGVMLVTETWIRRSENQLLGLDGLKYDHRSA